MRRRFIAGFLTLLLLWSTFVYADASLKLPGERYEITLPGEMKSEGPVAGDPETLKALYVGNDLEVEIFTYGLQDGMTVDSLVKSLTEAGYTAEIREVNGIRMICYRYVDETDNAPCIGYCWEDGDRFLEVCFWYGSEEAGKETQRIMESITVTESDQ